MKILVIEDHKLVRELLVGACASLAPDVDAKGASNGAEGIEMARRFQPDIIFLDLALPDGDGLGFLPKLAEACRSAKVIALTSHPDEFTIHRALKASVFGFIDKNEQPLSVLKEAVATVNEGRRYFSPVVQQVHMAMRNDPSDFSKTLTDREQELLGLFGAGLSNEDIATRLNVSPGTVKIHRINIMNKLDIHSAAGLVIYAMEKGFTRVQQGTRPVSNVRENLR